MQVPRLSIDYVIDIESFFYVQDKRAYLREVHSILKEGGRLFLAFFMQRTKLEEIHNLIRLFYDIEKEDDITDNALHALRLDNQNIKRMIDQHSMIGKSTTTSIFSIKFWRGLFYLHKESLIHLNA